MNEKPPAEAFPLYWPEGWQRSLHRRESNFHITGFGRVRDGVIRELRLMRGRHVVISSNLPLRRDGLPYANQPDPQDPGISVYWFDGKTRQQRCMACDRWKKIIDNLRAIELSLGALRGLDRWGSTEIVNRAFSGFTALPPAGDDWRSVLGIPYGERPPLEVVKQKHRDLARSAHPDHGGNQHEMVRLNQALQAAEKDLQ